MSNTNDVYNSWGSYANDRFGVLPFKDQSENMGFFVNPIIGLAAREQSPQVVPDGSSQASQSWMPPLLLPKEDDLQVDNPNVNPNYQPVQQKQVAPVQQQLLLPQPRKIKVAPAQPPGADNYTQAEIQNLKTYGTPQAPPQPDAAAAPTQLAPAQPAPAQPAPAVQPASPQAVTYQIPDTTQDAYNQVMSNYYAQRDQAVPELQNYWHKANAFANDELTRQALIRQREEEQFQEAKARSERAAAKAREGDGSSWWNPTGILTGLGEIFYGSRKYNPQTRQYELTAPTSWKEATQNIMRNITTAGSGLSFGYGKGGLRTAYNAAMPEYYRAKREQNQRAPHAAWEAAQDQLLAQSIDPTPRQPLLPWTFRVPMPTVDHPFTNFMLDTAQKEAAFKAATAQAQREKELFGLSDDQYTKRLRELTGQPVDYRQMIDEYKAYADANNIPERERNQVIRELEYAALGLNAPAQEEDPKIKAARIEAELDALQVPAELRPQLRLQLFYGNAGGKGGIDYNALVNGGWTEEKAKQLAPELISQGQKAVESGDPAEAKAALELIRGFKTGTAKIKLADKAYDRGALSEVETALEAIVNAANDREALSQKGKENEKAYDTKTKDESWSAGDLVARIMELGKMNTESAKRERERLVNLFNQNVAQYIPYSEFQNLSPATQPPNNFLYGTYQPKREAERQENMKKLNELLDKEWAQGNGYMRRLFAYTSPEIFELANKQKSYTKTTPTVNDFRKIGYDVLRKNYPDFDVSKNYLTWHFLDRLYKDYLATLND